jgi:hypothetical protein
MSLIYNKNNKGQILEVRLFADDTSLSYSGQNLDLMQIEINNDLQILDQWAKTWLVDFNPKKTKGFDKIRI